MLKTEKYHVHLYYKLGQIELASNIRDKMKEDIPDILGFGSLRKISVGPHPAPMFEAWFLHETLNSVIDWVILNRGDFSVMFHPLSGDDYEDHATHAFWIGEALPLNLAIFK